MAWSELGDEDDPTSSTSLRADELAAEVGISVALLRSYQSKGLLPPPRHAGRVAWYGPHHRERLLHILDLKERGYSLRMIAEAVEAGGDGPAWSIEEREVLLLAEVAERSGVPVAVLRALEASGLLRPHHLVDGVRYSEADVRFVRNVLTLLDVGLSLEDLMRIAHQQLVTADALGRDVMEAWTELVGSRLRRGRGTPSDQASRAAASIRALAAIVGQLVAYGVERAVLDAARSEIESAGSDAERQALARSLGAARDG